VTLSEWLNINAGGTEIEVDRLQHQKYEELLQQELWVAGKQHILVHDGWTFGDQHPHPRATRPIEIQQNEPNMNCQKQQEREENWIRSYHKRRFLVLQGLDN
jgi:hypothetical protein